MNRRTTEWITWELHRIIELAGCAPDDSDAPEEREKGGRGGIMWLAAFAHTHGARRSQGRYRRPSAGATRPAARSSRSAAAAARDDYSLRSGVAIYHEFSVRCHGLAETRPVFPRERPQRTTP